MNSSYESDSSRGAGSQITRLSHAGLFGVVLIMAGALLLLSNLFPYDVRWSMWWPALLVAWGILRLVNAGGRGWTFSIILVVLGVLMLLDRHVERFHLGFGVIIALGAIALGISILFKSRPTDSKSGVTFGNNAQSTSDDTVKAVAILGHHETRTMSRQFSGGDLTAIFGNALLDLREADLAPGAVISVTAVFGSIELCVPESWDVRLIGTPILGTFKDQRKCQANMSSDRTLIIDGTCAFGSVEVK